MHVLNIESFSWTTRQV